MAEILPFRALHYDQEKVAPLEKLVTQPYDRITPQMQARYYDLSPYNLVRIIRGLPTAPGNAGENVYQRAARYFHEWIDSRVLVSEFEPALYPYFQEYWVPGKPGVKKQRQGFIALCRLENYAARVVHRHEETLSGPKADRLELLKATRAHFGQIFLLYSDPSGSIEAALAAIVHDRPWERAKDEYSTLHSVWRVTDPLTIERVVEAMRAKKLVIADGHHRYETALAYRDHCRKVGMEDTRAEYVMATFIRQETDGLTVLATHRVLHGLSTFDWEKFLAKAGRFFAWEEFRTKGAVEQWRGEFLGRLSQAGGRRATLGAYVGPGKLGLLRLREDLDLATELADVPPGLRRLDVVLLHHLLIEKVLGIDPQAVREERNLRYVREVEVAVGQVDHKQAQVCFLMNPTPVAEVWENALAGNVLPQKSTDFYPKLLSGLTIYWLNSPAGI